MTAELINLGPRGIADAIRTRRVSAREVAQAFLARVADAAPLNAVAYVDPAAVLAMADQADRDAAGGSVAPLLGVPFTVKDSIAVDGWPWRSGSIARRDVVATEDGVSVARLRALGALPLCKTTTPEYTWSAQTVSALHGCTNNPYDLTRSSGGSSGGEAALHAVGAAPFGLGTDGLNSIRLPAHFCGTAGLRPTVGIVPEVGVWPATRATGLLDISTTGPMAPRASALRDVFLAIAGAHTGDLFSHDFVPVVPATATVGAVRVGVLGDGWLGTVSAGTTKALNAVHQFFLDAGSDLVDVSPWDVSHAVDLAFRLMAPDGGSRARADLAAAEGQHAPEFARLLAGLGEHRLDIDQYLAAVQELAAFRRSFREAVESVTVVVAPVAIGPAPLHDRLPGDDASAADIDAFQHCFAVALAGLPSAVVPVGMERGLPIGVQVIGRAGSDLTVLDVASQLEEAFQDHVAPPTAWIQATHWSQWG